MGDILDKKSLTNKHIISLILFVVTWAILGTYFITKEVIAKPILSPAEKEQLMNHVNKVGDNALKRQKIDLQQQAFNQSILEKLRQDNREIIRMNSILHKHTDNKIAHK